MTPPAGVTVRPLNGQREREACVALQYATWGDDFDEAVPTAILLAAQHTGGVASGAFDASGALLGFVFGISGFEGERRVHWSDMLAVREDARGLGLGLALKLHQRELLLGRGVETVYWTFDPLVARNAHINFGRLGATAGEYLRDVYGDTGSHLHAGIGTDRLLARWDIAGERVARRLAGGSMTTSPAAPLANPAGADAEPDLSLESERVAIAVPADIQALKAEAPEVALRWRAVTRRAFEHYLGRGLVVLEARRADERLLYELGPASASPADTDH